ncbi:unnamed protein product, partial [Rotaria magnacalcarata]
NTSSTSSLLPSPTPAVLSTTTADTNELMKKIDYFIKCYVAFLIDVFQPSKSVFGTNSGSILVQVKSKFHTYQTSLYYPKFLFR